LSKKLTTFKVVSITAVLMISAFFVVNYFYSDFAFAADFYWVGGDVGNENDWNNANNWSASSGGAGGVGVPGSGDAVIFDSGSSVDCTLDTSLTITSVANTNYVGTLSFGSNTLTTNSTFTFRSGTLNLGSGILSTSGLTELRSATIVPGTSTVSLNATSDLRLSTSAELYNVDINANNSRLGYQYGELGDWQINNRLRVADGITAYVGYHTDITLASGATLDLNSTGSLQNDSYGILILEDATSSTIPASNGTIGVPLSFVSDSSDSVIVARSYGDHVYIKNTGTIDRVATIGTVAGQAFACASFQVYANGDGDMTVDASTYNPSVTTISTGSYQFNFSFDGAGAGDEIINAGSGIWTIGSSNVDLRDGILNSGTSTFKFNREWSIYNQEIYSDGNTFYEIVNANDDPSGLIFKDSVSANTFTYTNMVGDLVTQFEPGITATFTNLNVSGDATHTLIFQPVGTSADWYLNVTNSPTVSYVNVKYSDASSGSTILANDGTSVDSGNNLNWNFGSVYWVSATEKAWSSGDWSYTSGGASGASAPTSSDSVVFDSNGVGNCNLDGSIDVANLDIGSGYSGTVDAGSYQMSVSGDVDLTGGFDGASATLVADGVDAQTVIFAGEVLNTFTSTNTHANGVTFSGATTVVTLNAVIDNSYLFFDNTTTFTVSTTLNIGGSASGKVYLQSDSDGDQWDITIPSGLTKNYLYVKDSVASEAITADYSSDGGNNNANWTFILRPEAHWLLDDDFSDSSGNSHTGTNSGSDITAAGVLYDTSNDSTQAGAQFTSSESDYVDVGDINDFSVSKGITVSAWIYKNTDGGDAGFYSSDDNSTGNYYGFWFMHYGNAVALAYGDGTGALSSDRRSKTTGDVLSYGVWQHVVGVIRGPTDMTIYVDGVDVGGTYSGTGGAELAHTSWNARIGSRRRYGGYFNGRMDDVRLYKDALNETQALELYNNYYEGSGDWSSNSSWEANQLPASEGLVNVDSGTLSLDTDREVGSLNVSAGTFDFGSNNLSVSGDVSIAGSIIAGTGTLTLNGSSDQALLADGETFNNITITNPNTVDLSGSITVSGILTNSTASSTMVFDNTATYTIGDLTLNGQALGTRITLESDSGSDRWDLVVSGSQSISYVTVSDSDASGGDLIDADDGTNENAGNVINWLFPPTTYYWVGSTTSWNEPANWSDSSGGSGGVGVPNNGDTVIFDNQDATNCTLDTTVAIEILTNINYAGEFDADIQNITISGDLTFQSGILSLGSDTWSVGGDVNLTGATVNADDSTLMMTGNAKTFATGNKTINNFIAKNTTSSNYEIIIAGNLLLNGNLYVVADGTGDETLDFETNDGDVSVTSNIDFTGTGAGSENIEMGDGTWLVSGSVDFRNGSIDAGGSTFSMDGDDKNLMSNNQTYYNLHLQSEINIPYIYNDTYDLLVSNNLLIEATGQMTMWLSSTLTILKDATLSLSGPIVKSGGGEIVFVDPTSTTITSVSNIGVPITFRANSRDIYIAGLTYGSGICIENNSANDYTAYLGTVVGQTISVNGSLQMKAEGAGNLIVDGATYNPAVTTSNYGGYRRYFGFFGSGGGAETLNAGSGTWTVGASDVDFRDGTLSAGTSTFIFNRDYSLWHQHVYSGGNSFNIITCQNTDWRDSSGLVFRDNVTAGTFNYSSPENPGTVQFEPESTATFTNFNVSGGLSRRIILKPHGSNSAWYLNVANQPTLSYVEPYYSDASIGSKVYASDGTSVDGGNNINWVFPAEAPVEEEEEEEEGEDEVVVVIGDEEDEVEEEELVVEDENELIIGEEDEIVPDKDGFVTLVGEGTPGAQVIVKIRGKEYSTKVGQDGRWRLVLFLDDGNYNAKVTYINPDGSRETEYVKFRVKSARTKSSWCDYWCWLGGITLAIFIFFIIFWKRRKKEEEEGGATKAIRSNSSSN